MIPRLPLTQGQGMVVRPRGELWAFLVEVSLVSG